MPCEAYDEHFFRLLIVLVQRSKRQYSLAAEDQAPRFPAGRAKRLSKHLSASGCLPLHARLTLQTALSLALWRPAYGKGKCGLEEYLPFCRQAALAATLLGCIVA